MQTRAILNRVEKPGRYVGGEWNHIDKSESFNKLSAEEGLHTAFCFPDLYEIAMSNLALQILYQAINAQENMFCERAFMPAPDMRAIMRSENILLESIETGTALSEFDVLAFSLHYELSYSAVLEMLSLSGIPFYSKERDDSHPLIIAGGPISCNLEPMAEFFDLIQLGEGERICLSCWCFTASIKAAKRPVKLFYERQHGSRVFMSRAFMKLFMTNRALVV